MEFTCIRQPFVLFKRCWRNGYDWGFTARSSNKFEFLKSLIYITESFLANQTHQWQEERTKEGEEGGRGVWCVCIISNGGGEGRGGGRQHCGQHLFCATSDSTRLWELLSPVQPWTDNGERCAVLMAADMSRCSPSSTSMWLLLHFKSQW